jgi:HK97 gp10 family phage protein
MGVVKVSFTGFQEFNEVMKDMKNDFDEKDQKKILTTAVRSAMKPVLSRAQALVPEDTGALRASLRIEARKPTRKDRKSIYVNTSDVAIATVTTAPGKVLAKKKFMNKRTGKKQVGIASDARAIANEFGTAKMPAHPFMRPALESSTGVVVSDLADQLRNALTKYKSRKQ